MCVLPCVWPRQDDDSTWPHHAVREVRVKQQRSCPLTAVPPWPPKDNPPPPRQLSPLPPHLSVHPARPVLPAPPFHGCPDRMEAMASPRTGRRRHAWATCAMINARLIAAVTAAARCVLCTAGLQTPACCLATCYSVVCMYTAPSAASLAEGMVAAPSVHSHSHIEACTCSWARAPGGDARCARPLGPGCFFAPDAALRTTVASTAAAKGALATRTAAALEY